MTLGDRIRTAVRGRGAILAILGAALLLRGIVAFGSAGLPALIEDEQHYVALAGSLRSGHGFGWGADWPTSIRPPLYPAFIAGVWTVAGVNSLDVVRWGQIPVALAGIFLLYQIGRRWFSERSALIAAAALAVYPSFLFSGALLLTETLFTTLLLGFAWCFLTLSERSSPGIALAAGVALGLATLTRSVLWPFIAVAVPMLWVISPAGRRGRAAAVAALALGYCLVVGPWAARNTAVQGTFTMVDTMGGLNLLMGNYAHTPEDRMWDGVGVRQERAWAASLPPAPPGGGRWTERTKELWAQRQAIAYMRANPLTTLRRSVLKFADFWGLERDFAAGVLRGYYSPPMWLTAAATGGMALTFMATCVLAVLGICLAPPGRRAHVVLLAVVLFICAVHSIVFGHSRYHLPVVPILLLYASAAVASARWRDLFTAGRPAVAAVAMILALAAIWSHELFMRDWSRVQQLLALL